ncbi:MAG TPA: mechanosensitive ion channel family protein [Bacteroidales bacterium]|nr:mechanosensitive ion channel family protein [Bacteroidales bacterium]
MEEKIQSFWEKVVPWLLSHGIKIVVIAVVAWITYIVLSRIVRRAVKISVVRDQGMTEEAEIKRENTLIRIFNGAIRIIMILIALLMILQEVGIEIGPILAGAGVVGLAVGFGAQYLIRDIITGLFIILENQYRIGDVINIGSEGGVVEDISLRMTTLRDLNGTVHHIPHGEVTRVSNLTKSWSRVNINIGVSYNANIEKVIDVINRTGEKLAEDPQFKDSIISPPKFLRVDEFADSSVVVKILGETKPSKQWEVAGEFRKRIKAEFDREGIEIPFPQRVVHQIKGN